MAAAVRAMTSCRPFVLLCSGSLYWLCILSISMNAPLASSLFFNLSFSQPQSRGLDRLLNLAGDAHLTPDTLELTPSRRDQTTTYEIGRATYAQPVPLWDATTGEMAGFTTAFSFRIAVDQSASYHGDGMAFFLGHVGSGIPPNSEGANLGLLPYATNGTGDTTMVAVEFDTFFNRNPNYNDISIDHVGIDVNSLFSAASTDTTSPTNNLTSGFTMTATVTYHNVTKFLAVELDIGGTFYYVNTTVDLRRYLPEHVAVGFSAATGAVGELHQLLSWSFTSTLQEAPAPAPPPPTPLPTPPKKRSVGVLIIISVLGGLFLLACCAAVLVWRQRQKHRRRRSGARDYHRRGTTPPNGSSDDDNDYHEQDDGSRAELERGVAASGPRRYAYRELAAATNDFAEDCKLGRGGFGSVYRGKLAVSGEERPVAIKVLSSESSAQGRKEFEAEVTIISRLKHRNLVQLLGWCDSRNGLLLVYELVAKGSLDKHLHSSNGDGDDKSFLTWPERYQIILGLGSALRYLHEEGEKPVVHGDIKPSNIMLDESLGAKLGDFGLARLGDHGVRWRTTNAVLGTAGYIDPEFVNTRHPGAHSDVYSFGIVLLEIVSDREPFILREDGAHFILLKWVWALYGQLAILDAADARLRAGGGEVADDDRCMERVLVVGLWCAHPDQSERPSISQAMHVLQSDDARLPVLTPQMYNRPVSDFAVTGQRAYGALSIHSSSSTNNTATGGSSRVSSEPYCTALLRDSRDLA